MHLEATLLGPPSLRWNGAPLDVRSRKGMAILLYLGVRAQAVPRVELAELLWRANGARNLRHEIFQLRKLPGARTWFTSGERLTVAVESDLEAFEHAVSEARFDDAIAGWTGPPLQGFELPSAAPFEDWLQQVRRRFEELLIRAQKGRLDVLLDRACYAEAVELVERLWRLDPLDESTYRTAMRSHYGRNDPESALRWFETCRRTLLQELGVQPSAATHALAHEIELGSSPPGAAGTHPRVRVPTRLLRPPTLVGREAEWAIMEQAWADGQSIFICGQAGIGKSRLLLDFARSRGAYLLNEGRTGDEHLPYSSATRALGRAFAAFPGFAYGLDGWARDELSRLLPTHLSPAKPPPSDRGEIRPRLVQAILHMMERLRPLVAALPADDIHYYDRASGVIGNAISAHFAKETSPGTAGMLMAFRKDEMPEGNLQGIEALCRAGAAVLIELPPLGRDAMGALLTDLEVEDDVAALLHGYTGGNPMFTLEMLKAMVATGEISAASFHATKPPGRVASVFEARFERLSEAAVRLVRAVAVAQPEASAAVLAHVLEVDPFDVAEGLAELERVQILSGERFVHDLLYEYTLRSMPRPMLRLLHQRTAEALIALEGDPHQVARHWHGAGEPSRAVRSWLDAARGFRGRSLHDGADEMLQLAVRHAPTADLEREAKRELARSHAGSGRD